MKGLTAAEIGLAYRLVLKRAVDPDGLRNYLRRGEDGLRLQELVAELFASGEYLSSVGPEPVANIPAANDAGAIAPTEMMERYSLDELIQTADDYYTRIPDPTPLLVKPLGFLNETPHILRDLGLLLSDLDLGKGMMVLDFGAGTGWLSRMLAQLHCRVIACDVSAAALELGRETLRRLPLVGAEAHDPTFLVFDGRRLPLPDDSVDRIVCFDSFHHVPNPSDVLREFARVLRQGGVVGFSEPGRYHSTSAQSQYEMKNHRVLENDIRIEDLFRIAAGYGFTDARVRVFGGTLVSVDEYLAVLDPESADHWEIESRAWNAVKETALSQSMFYFSQGERVLDSRQHTGLAHRIVVAETRYQVSPSQPFTVSITASNTGHARWLSQNGGEIFGVVRVGTHLFDDTGKLIAVDFTRHELTRDVAPAGSIDMDISLSLPERGTFRIVVDLVAEGVTWFENAGSSPVDIRVSVV